MAAAIGESDFQLAPGHDTAVYAAEFAASGRVHIPNLLRDGDARRLRQALLERLPWHLLVIHGEHRQLPLAQWEAIPPEHRQKMEEQFAAGARMGFSARYLTSHLSNDGESYALPDPELGALVRFLNGDAFLSFARAVTGDAAITLTDVHASHYRPGDFLHRHDDRLKPEDGIRSAAYILNLTPTWRAEWGGLLNFLRDDGHIDGAFTPVWNALNFLKVPQMHFVGTVAPFVIEPRLSVSGWVRRR
jgi:Rps23 Pro-64 3,4-dihydroxylase Tpa1-like proline 4-hydroxylase